MVGENSYIYSILYICSVDMLTLYKNGDDYTYNSTTGAITWLIDPEPEPGHYFAIEAEVDHDILNLYFNNGIFSLNLEPYSDKAWVMQACIDYLGKPKTKEALENILSILAGREFSKYYANMAITNGKFIANYAINVTHEYEEFLLERGLGDYSFIDEETGEVYDGAYPDNGVNLTLCHKDNIGHRDEGYYIITRSETFDTDAAAVAREYGEHVPDKIVGSIGENVFIDTQTQVIPIYGIVPIAGQGVTATYLEEHDEYIDDIMMVEWVDETEILSSDVTVISATEIEVKNSGHIYRAGEEIVVCGPDLDIPANIVTGWYNVASDTYILKLSVKLNEGDHYGLHYSLRMSSRCAVEKEEGFSVVISALVPADSMAVLKSEINHQDRVSTVADLREFEGSTYSVGDVVSITYDGEQTYHSITGITTEGGVSEAELYPTIEGYSDNAIVYNMGSEPLVNRIAIKDPEDDIGPIRKLNIARYLELWLPGQTLFNGLNGQVANYNLDKIRIYDNKYWDKIGREAKIEVKV